MKIDLFFCVYLESPLYKLVFGYTFKAQEKEQQESMLTVFVAEKNSSNVVTDTV